jgi:hypothetical protein
VRRCGSTLRSRMAAAMLSRRCESEEESNRKQQSGRADRQMRRARLYPAILVCCALPNHGVLSFLITYLSLCSFPVLLANLWLCPGAVLPRCPPPAAGSRLVRR